MEFVQDETKLKEMADLKPGEMLPEDISLIMKKDKTAEDYYELFTRARDFDIPRLNEYEELMAFYEGRQDLLSRYSGEKPWVMDVTTGYATDAIDTRIASLIANDYNGELEPLSPEDVDSISALNSAQKMMWRFLEMDNVIKESIRRSAVIREAYTHIVYDDVKFGGTNRKMRGKLSAYFINPANVFVDPNALEFKEADYVCITERISPKKVKDQYPSFDFKAARANSLYTSQERGEIFLGNDYDTEQEEVLTKITFYEVTKHGTPKQTIHKTVLVENQIVEDTTKMKTKYLPIAQLRWKKRMDSPYGISLMDALLPSQKAINSIEGAIINTALAFAVPSFVVSKDSGLDPQDVARSAGAPGVVYPVEGSVDQAIRPLMQGKVVDDQMLIIKKENEDTIYKLAGVTQQFQGDIGSAGNTAGGTDQAVNRATLIEHNFFSNLEEYIEDLTNIVTNYIIQIYSGQTMYSRGEKQTDGRYNFNMVNVPEGLEDVEYTFNIDLDITTQFNRERFKELTKELFQMERQYDAPVKVITIKDILKQYNMPNREELIRRYDDIITKDNDSKAAVISEFTKVTSQFQIDPELVQQAIAEIIDGKESKMVEMVMQQVQQLLDQQRQQQEQVAQQQEAAAEEQQLQQDQMGLMQEDTLNAMPEQLGLPADVAGEEEFNLAQQEGTLPESGFNGEEEFNLGEDIGQIL